MICDKCKKWFFLEHEDEDDNIPKNVTGDVTLVWHPIKSFHQDTSNNIVICGKCYNTSKRK